MMWSECKKPAGRGRRTLPPYASINQRGEIVLNPTVYAALHGLNYVSLRYDDQTNTIVIARPTVNGHIYNVRNFGRKGRLRVIRAKRFLTHLRLQIQKTRQFTDICHTQNPDSVILGLGTASCIM